MVIKCKDAAAGDSIELHLVRRRAHGGCHISGWSAFDGQGHARSLHKLAHFGAGGSGSWSTAGSTTMVDCIAASVSDRLRCQGGQCRPFQRLRQALPSENGGGTPGGLKQTIDDNSMFSVLHF